MRLDECLPASNIDTAIRACREEKSNTIQSHQQMQMVKEKLSGGYCDISGTLGDLTRFGESNGWCLWLCDKRTGARRDGRGVIVLFEGYSRSNQLEDRRLTNARADVPDPAELLKLKKDPIARFIHAIQPIRDVFQLTPTSMHIFCDVSGGTIAFNRNASIFVNLRYFEAWRVYDHLGRCFQAHEDSDRRRTSEEWGVRGSLHFVVTDLFNDSQRFAQ